MVKVAVEKLENDTGVFETVDIPTLNIEAEKGLYVFGTVERVWTYNDKRFPSRDGTPNRVGLTIDVEDAKGYMWDPDTQENILIDHAKGKHNLFFRHQYLLKVFMNEDGTPKREYEGKPIIIYNRGKGNSGFMYKVVSGQEAVSKYLEE